ncbi:MAG: protein adenylyltransferase SelO [Thermodesulfobacteriota bacterium]
MRKITELNFENTYSKLPAAFYQEVKPTPLKNPFLAAFNDESAYLIDLCLTEKNNPEIAEFLSGKKLIPGSNPVAMYYTGHQFGVYNARIGDGRAILLGEVRNSKNKKYDLHLKGSGRTKFSRQFDGRAVMRSTIREYLCSEAMFYLGISTTRALCIVGSGEKVEREKDETVAAIIRMAETHVRFGSFEAFYFDKNYEHIKTLADYVIDHSYPEFKNEDNKYKLFIFKAAEKTAELIAKWQAFGFTHGVMNTDNMSITGLTLDYGPFGFMENFKQDYIPNHSDHFGRYSYQNQPSIGYWNFGKLIQSLQTIISSDEGIEALERYKNIYFNSYYELMLKKFGFENKIDKDRKFIDNTLEILEKFKIDYQVFFRKLSNFKRGAEKIEDQYLKKLSVTSKELSEWFEKYRSRLKKETLEDNERKKSMKSVNPKYILRNYICEQVIREAEDNKNYSEIDRIRKVFLKPFDEQPEYEEYAKESPDWAKGLVISCSS